MDKELRFKRYREKFKTRYDVTPDGCWLWNGSAFDDGYGAFYFEGNNRRAHRVSYVLYVGQIPDGYHVCHKCDVPACVNPDHLWLGTQKDNMRDAYDKGRKNDRGSANAWSKLTEDQVKEIRTLYPEYTQTALAKMFGVCQAHISDIVTGRRGVWSSVR